MHIQYMLDAKQLKKVYTFVQEKIFTKIFNADQASFKYTSKEQMLNTITNNIAELSDFCDVTAYKFSHLVQAISTLVLIFSCNIYIGLIIVSTSLLVFFMLKFINAKIAKKSVMIMSERDKLTETFSDIIDNIDLSKDMNLENALKEKYFDQSSNILKCYKKRNRLKSIRDNWIFLFYNLIVFLSTLFAVNLVKTDVISVTLYLVLTPYLTTSITKFSDFFSLFDDLESANINALRVKTLLDMSEKDLENFGNNQTVSKGDFIFSNVAYSSENKPLNLGSIKSFSLEISHGQIVLFKGERNCGKRAIFYMLKRSERPDQGTITEANINIYDFSLSAYNKIISYATSKPHFYNGSILDNLKMIDPNKKNIYNACKKLKIYDKISNLPQGFNTDISKNPTALSIAEQFLLSVARALLTKSEVIMIYEFPPGLSVDEQTHIKNAIKALRHEKTVILFASSNNFEDICDSVFEIKDNALTKIKSTKQSTKTPIKIDSQFSK